MAKRKKISVEELCKYRIPEYFSSDLGTKEVLQIHNCNLFNKKLFLYKDEDNNTHLAFIPSKFSKNTISTMEKIIDLSEKEVKDLIEQDTNMKTTILYKSGEKDDNLIDLALEIVRTIIVSSASGDPFWYYGNHDLPYKKEDWDMPDSEKYVSVELISENDFKQLLIS